MRYLGFGCCDSAVARDGEGSPLVSNPLRLDGSVRPGLYVSTVALTGHEEQVPAGKLVQLANDTEQGVVSIHPTKANKNRRWSFQERGIAVRDLRWLASLTPCLPEGYYVLKRPVHVTQETILPQRSLVQLAYSAAGFPILYVAHFEGTSIVFPTAGYKFSSEIFTMLQEAGFLGPSMPEERQLH